MSKRILVTYLSVTGFTKEYAEMIAGELECQAVDFKSVSEKTMAEYDTVIFGGRCHASMIGGLAKAKKLFNKSGAKDLIVFATGATPNAATELIDEIWKNNLTPTEQGSIPHFYMQSGLRYERMPLGDRLIMKAFSAMMKKKNQTENDRGMGEAITGSYDISSRDYILPLVDAARQTQAI